MPKRKAKPHPLGQDAEFFMASRHRASGFIFVASVLFWLKIPNAHLDRFKNRLRHRSNPPFPACEEKQPKPHEVTCARRELFGLLRKSVSSSAVQKSSKPTVFFAICERFDDSQDFTVKSSRGSDCAGSLRGLDVQDMNASRIACRPWPGRAPHRSNLCDCPSRQLREQR